MIKTRVKAVTRLAAILGFAWAMLLLGIQSAGAQSLGVHEGKFSVAVNGKTRIYKNATTVTQTVLVTVCVNTAGPQTADIAARDDAGNLVATLAGVKFGQCRSVTAELASTDNISVGPASTAANFSGTYTLSIL
jgi:hypothetical protein